jgi:hypothetical protein
MRPFRAASDPPPTRIFKADASPCPTKNRCILRACHGGRSAKSASSAFLSTARMKLHTFDPPVTSFTSTSVASLPTSMTWFTCSSLSAGPAGWHSSASPGVHSVQARHTVGNRTKGGAWARRCSLAVRSFPQRFRRGAAAVRSERNAVAAVVVTPGACEHESHAFADNVFATSSRRSWPISTTVEPSRR